MVGKKCTRHYAADWVSASFRDASELLCLHLHQNTLRRMETQISTGILVNKNASGGDYCQVWHDWAPKERAIISFCQELSAHNCSESSCRCPVVSKIAVGPETKHPKIRTTAGHKFRPSVNLDEFDSLQRSSDPSNATGTTSSVGMRANLWQNNCYICGYAQLEPQLHLIPSSIHCRWHSGSWGYL